MTRYVHIAHPLLLVSLHECSSQEYIMYCSPVNCFEKPSLIPAKLKSTTSSSWSPKSPQCHPPFFQHLIWSRTIPSSLAPHSTAHSVPSSDSETSPLEIHRHSAAISSHPARICIKINFPSMIYTIYIMYMHIYKMKILNVSYPQPVVSSAFIASCKHNHIKITKLSISEHNLVTVYLHRFFDDLGKVQDIIDRSVHLQAGCSNATYWKKLYLNLPGLDLLYCSNINDCGPPRRLLASQRAQRWPDDPILGQISVVEPA